VEYVNNRFATMLGRTPEAMERMTLADVMPQPFGALHPKWMKVRAAAPAVDRLLMGW